MQKHVLGDAVLKIANRDPSSEGGDRAPLTQPINGVIYCRVSSKEQIDGTSLESQEIACKEYARSRNITVLKVFVERGESAKAADRTQLIELIDFCRTSKEKVRVLLVWKVDRFARNVGDHFNIKATLLKYGVRVVSVTEPIDANPEGKLMETILAGFAQFDNDIRATRTVQGMRRKIQEGIFPWKPPLGYRSAARENPKKTVPDEPNQPLFGLLQKAWRQFATGAYTKADIQRLMNSWGVQTANGISMTAQSLDNFFRNPFYAGTLTDPWSEEGYSGKHVPMVSPEDFQRVQEIISRRSRAIPHRKERMEFPLRGLARCTECQHYLTGGLSQGRSKRYAYYHCGNRKCPLQPNYPAQELHDEFGAFLASVNPKPGVMENLSKRILKVAETRRSDSKSREDRRDADVARLDNEVQELIRMRTQHLVTDEEFVALKTRLSERRMALTDIIVPERSALDAGRIQAEIGAITRPLTELRATWRSIPVGFQRRFNHMVLPVGFVIGEYRTADLGPIFKAFGGLDGVNSQEVPLKGTGLNRLIEAIQAFAELFRSIKEEKKDSLKRGSKEFKRITLGG